MEDNARQFEDFEEFLKAVQDSSPETKGARSARHTSSVGTEDWKAIQDALESGK